MIGRKRKNAQRNYEEFKENNCKIIKNLFCTAPILVINEAEF